MDRNAEMREIAFRKKKIDWRAFEWETESLVSTLAV
jgi:hypothetical protein